MPGGLTELAPRRSADESTLGDAGDPGSGARLAGGGAADSNEGIASDRRPTANVSVDLCRLVAIILNSDAPPFAALVRKPERNEWPE